MKRIGILTEAASSPVSIPRSNRSTGPRRARRSPNRRSSARRWTRFLHGISARTPATTRWSRIPKGRRSSGLDRGERGRGA